MGSDFRQEGGIAIYSLNIRSIGRSTHAARTASAHVRYITRPEARPVILAERMPKNRQAAQTWLNGEERSDRKNARVADKLTIALPRELDADQRRQLVQRFANLITKDRASWFAAIHQIGADAHNPHVHLLVRDRDITTGKRVFGLSERGSCERVRSLWQDVCNTALQDAAQAVQIDRRSFYRRKLAQIAQRHRGAYKWKSEPFGQFADAVRLCTPILSTADTPRLGRAHFWVSAKPVREAMACDPIPALYEPEQISRPRKSETSPTARI